MRHPSSIPFVAVITALLAACGGIAVVEEGSIVEDCETICAAFEGCGPGSSCGCLEVYETSVDCAGEAATLTACLAAHIDLYDCDDSAAWAHACEPYQRALDDCDRR